MPRNAYRALPSTPSGTVELAITVPDSEEAYELVAGALTSLVDPANYEAQPWTITADATAAAMMVVGDSILEYRMAVPIGTIIPFCGEVVPSNYLLCNGASYLASDYPQLSLIGGLIQVQPGGYIIVPNLQGRVPIGTGTSPSSGVTRNLGEVGGSDNHTLNSSQMPAHTHIQQAHSHQQYGLNVYPIQTGNVSARLQDDVTLSPTSSTTAVNQVTGGGAAHNNLQPYMALAYIIKAR